MKRRALTALACLPFFGAAQAGGITPRILAGIHANQDGACTSVLTVGACEADLANVESQTGHPFAIVSEYCHFTECQQPGAMQFAIDAINAGKVAMVTWYLSDPGHCQLATDFPKHVYDAELLASVNQFALVPAPFIIRPDPAMDSPQRRCYYDTDDIAQQGVEFVAMWVYIHDFFRDHGVTNARFNWAASLRVFVDKYGNPITTWTNFYPGPEYVDWVGTMIYNPTETPESIQTDPRFLAWYNQVVTLGKPLMFSETGAFAGKAGDRWLYSMASKLQSFPALQALVYFHVNGLHGDFRLDTESDMVAMGNMQQRRYFSRFDIP